MQSYTLDGPVHAFDLRSAAVQNNMVGNIMPNTLANQLRPLAREMAANGEQPFALLTATQHILSNVAKQGLGGTVVMPPTAWAFNAQAARQYKQF